MWISLLSGLIGSILGGFVTYMTTKYSLQETVKNSLLLDEQTREKDSLEKVETAKKALWIETEENLDAIERWEKARYNFSFSKEAWIVYKYIVPSFEVTVQYQLITTYTAIDRYNTIIGYDHHVAAGSGFYDKQKEDRIGEVKVELLKLQKLLEPHDKKV
ncbi:MAG: hypothetical protein WC489_04950 [Patescibacteria group bacterium]